MKHLLQEAIHEIRDLRRTNEIQAAKLEVFDCMMMMLHSKPGERVSQPYSPDVCWSMEKEIHKIDDAEKAQPDVANGPDQR